MSNMLRTLGLTDENEVFQRCWAQHGFTPRTLGPGETVTALSVQEAMRTEDNRKAWKGFARKSLHAIAKGGHPTETKGALTSGDISAVTPVVYDPEIMGILKENAPLLARVPIEGQRGFKAVYNLITARGGPIGFKAEADVLDMSALTASESTYAKSEVDMKIWVDKVQISDFAQAGGEHYFSLKDTELGQRLAVRAQAAEKAILYGDPSKAQANGSAHDTNAYEGAYKIYADAGASFSVDKSAVDISGTDALLKDIKKEVAKMLQGANAVNPADLEIWTSHTLFDQLENEMEVKRRVDLNANSMNYGFEFISIKGIPVFASHNVKQHTDFGGGNTGSEGDVFIQNKRAMRYRALMPLTVIPLARVGLADQAALAEFGAYIDRADGKLGKVLKGYAI